MLSDEYYMKQALLEAQKAFDRDEVPVGAVVVCQDRIIARAHNLTEALNDVTAHAEMQAITAAANYLGGKYLQDCTLYVTLEPCVMCFGAIVQARIQDVYFGAYDPKTGACGSLSDLRNLKSSSINHHTCFHGGILLEVCSEQIKTFFKKKRLEKSRDNGMEIS